MAQPIDEVPFGEDTGILLGALMGLDVPPAMTPTQWAAGHWVFSGDVSAEPGSYNPNRAAYQPGMLDVFIEPGIREATFKTSAQVGKTTTLMIIIGYCADRMPGPMLLVQPTRDVAEGFSKETLAGAIRDVPKMSKIFPDPRSREGDNTIFHKKFPGGFLALAGANSPIQLRRRAIRFGFADELDAWTDEATSEGDPIDLLERRLTTFWDSRLLAASTPLKQHKSRISRRYEESDQRKFVVPCPECAKVQVLEWKIKKGSEHGYKPLNIHWTPGQPETAEYACEHCGHLMSDLELKGAVRKGFWKAHRPFRGHAGFWIWELYSPWSSLSKIVATYEKAMGHTDRLESFVNTVLGLEWEGEVIGTVEVKTLLGRREKFEPYLVPLTAGLLTAGVDTQHDRLELMVMAWGLNDECWMMSHEQILGDPNGPGPWKLLEEALLRTYKHAGGQTLRVETAALDSGGLHTQRVYDFCAKNLLVGRLWWPIKGVAGWGKPIWKRSEITIKKGVKLILVGVDDAKVEVYKHFAVREPGPGYLHLPWAFHPNRDPGEDDKEIKASLERLTAEKLVRDVDPKGFNKDEWHKPSGARNEEFDCMVYAKAARTSLNVNMERRIQVLSQPPQPPIDPKEIARMFKRGNA